MLVKPATPLTAILLVAFTLLLLSVLSTPVVKSIPLATYGDISFGVFGYCTASACSGFQVGYAADGLFSDQSQNSDFNLPANIRASLSSLLVVHPVAAFLTLVCLCLAGAAHLHSPSHSPRYLLGLLILLLPTLLVTLLAFLVDILLFVPHLQWGGWIVLGATILLTTSGVMTCAMRRTLVSRKARKRRIAENAEMSGENYYNRQNTVKLDPPSTMDPQATSAPTADSLPTFATFTSPTREPDNDQQRLNSRSPPPPGFERDNASAFTTPGERNDNFGPLGPPEHGSRPPGREYGHGGPYGYPPHPHDNPMDPRLREQPSNSSMGSQRGGYGPHRGRGGMPMRGRGGPYPGDPRGGPPRGGFNGRGPPRGRMMGRGRPPPPRYPPHNPDMSPEDGPYGPPTGGPRYGSPGNGYDPRAPSPRMRGPSPNAPGNSRPNLGPPGNGPMDRQPSPGDLQSPTSVYSDEVYSPPRNNWNQNEPTLPNINPAPSGPSPVQTRSPLGQHTRSGSGHNNYYEDVEPHFTQPAPAESSNLPSTLTPGQHGELEPRTSFDDLPDGARSPTASETSHFTSISQRGVNPKWRPQEADRKHAQQQRQDTLLGSNPDFELPVGRGRGRPGARGRMQPMPAIPGTPDLPTVGGRY